MTEPAAPELDAEGNPVDKPKRKRVRKPAAQTRSTRFDRRTDAVAQTLKEVVRWLKVDWSDETDLSFVDTVDRDAQRIGTGLAAIGERVNPFGKFIDAIFGLTGPLAIVVALGPTVRAAYRDSRDKLAARRERLQQRKLQQEAERQETVDNLDEQQRPPDAYDIANLDRRSEWEGDPAAAGVE